MDLTLRIKEQFIDVTIKNGVLTETGTSFSVATEISNADELSNLSGDIEKDIPRIAQQLQSKNQDFRDILQTMPDGNYKLKRYLLC